VRDGTDPSGERNGKAKLTEDQVLAIRASASPGVQMAALYGVSTSVISQIRSRKAWAHI